MNLSPIVPGMPVVRRSVTRGEEKKRNARIAPASRKMLAKIKVEVRSQDSPNKAALLFLHAGEHGRRSMSKQAYFNRQPHRSLLLRGRRINRRERNGYQPRFASSLGNSWRKTKRIFIMGYSTPLD
jgi:hypothetical protein